MNDENSNKKKPTGQILPKALEALTAIEYCHVDADAEGFTRATYRLRDPHGVACAVILYPVGLVERIIQDAEKEADEILSKAVNDAPNAEARKVATAIKESAQDIFVTTAATAATQIYLHDLPEILFQALEETYQFAVMQGVRMTRRQFNARIKEKGWPIEFPDDQEKDKEFIKAVSTERAGWVRHYNDPASDGINAEEFRDSYQLLLPIWRDAKKIYEGNGDRETWRGMVRAKYPEIVFDDDLLTRITGQLSDLPEDIQTKVEEKGGDHTAATIALEHAARMCGAKHYQFGVRNLYKIKGANGKN